MGRFDYMDLRGTHLDPAEYDPPDCPVCGEGNLHHTTHSLSILLRPRDWGGPEIVVDGLEGMLCSHCREIITKPDQIRRNEKIIADARLAHQNEAKQEGDGTHPNQMGPWT